jgi:hypothetical protein
MPPDVTELGDSIRSELLLLRDLAGDLIACRKAFTGSDLDGIYEHISRQADLSEKLIAAQRHRGEVLNKSLVASTNPRGDSEPSLRSLMDTLDAPTAVHLRSLLTELALAEGEVRNLNRVHSLLLDGSRRTLNILSNALAAFAPTYPQPSHRNLSLPQDAVTGIAEPKGSRP